MVWCDYPIVYILVQNIQIRLKNLDFSKKKKILSSDYKSNRLVKKNVNCYLL